MQGLMVGVLAPGRPLQRRPHEYNEDCVFARFPEQRGPRQMLFVLHTRVGDAGKGGESRREGSPPSWHGQVHPDAHLAHDEAVPSVSEDRAPRGAGKHVTRQPLPLPGPSHAPQSVNS